MWSRGFGPARPEPSSAAREPKSGSVGGERLDRDAAARLEAHHAVGQREQREIAADADVSARVEARAALAHDDRPGADLLAAVGLHAAELGIGVATVAGRALAFFVCHDGVLVVRRGGRISGRAGSALDLRDLDAHVVLAVAALAADVLAALEAERDDLVSALVPDDLADDLRPCD